MLGNMFEASAFRASITSAQAHVAGSPKMRRRPQVTPRKMGVARCDIFVKPMSAAAAFSVAVRQA